jgi:hypothetical protein
MEIYIHGKESDEPKIVVVEEETLLEAVVVGHGSPGAGAWIENGEEELDLSLTVRELGIVERSHIHVNTCKRILVGVRQDTEKERDFSPSTTVARVYEWASGPEGFDLLPAERVKHTFVICGTTTEPDRAAHIGSYADDQCKVCFNLVPRHRSEGSGC